MIGHRGIMVAKVDGGAENQAGEEEDGEIIDPGAANQARVMMDGGVADTDGIFKQYSALCTHVQQW